MSEVKPCPYHGDPSAMEFSSTSNKFVACRKCDRENTTWYRPIEDWNNAFAWKEIDKWKALAGELLSTLEKCNGEYDYAGHYDVVQLIAKARSMELK